MAHLPQAEKEAIEKKCRPIYDSIDADNPKKALKDAETVLKRNPDCHTAKALKALAYLRLDRNEEAFQIIDQMMVADGGRKIYDEVAVQALVHCFKEASVPNRIAQMYDNICKEGNNPSEANLTALFMAYARVGENLDGMRLTAMRLNKKFPKSASAALYVHWVIATMIMQAEAATDEMKAKISWQLAERMLTNHINGSDYKNHAEVEMHVQILEKTGRYAEAAELLDSEAQHLLKSSPIFTVQRAMELWFMAKNYDSLMDRCENLLKVNCDDWSNWLCYFKTIFAKIDEAKNETEIAELEKRAVTCVAGFCAEEKPVRGPYMARFELTMRLLNAGRLNDTLGDPITQFEQYIKKFFKKPCCFADLSKYLPMITTGTQQKFYDFLEAFIHEDKESPEEHMRGIILFEKIRRRLGVIDSMDKQNKCAIVGTLLQGILKGGGNDLSGGEMGLLASAILWKEWKANDDWNAAVDLLCILEETSAKYKTDYYSKLVMLRMYGHMGILSRVFEIWKDLDIKSVQRDTLGFLHYPIYELVGRFSEHVAERSAVQIYTDLTTLYSQAEREISECMTGAFKNGHMFQIPGLVELRSKMNSSSLAAFADVSTRYMAALFSDICGATLLATMVGDSEEIDWEKLYDNRDFKTIPNWEPGNNQAELDSENLQSHLEFVDLVKLRHLLCRAMAVVGITTHKKESVRNAAVLLKAHIDHCKEHFTTEKGPSRSLHCATPVRLAEWVHGEFLTPILHLVNCGAEVAYHKEEGKEVSSLSADLLPTPEQLRFELEKLFPSLEVKKEPFFMQERLVTFSRTVETLSMCWLTLQSIELRMEPPVVSGKKKSKAKVAPVVERFNQIKQVVTESGEKLVLIIKETQEIMMRPDAGLIPETNNDWDKPDVRQIFVERRSVVVGNIIDSYTSSLNTLILALNTIFKPRPVPPPVVRK